MNNAYFLYSNNDLFVLLLPYTLAFLFFLSGALIRLISKESLLMGLHELLWAIGGLAYGIGSFFLFNDTHTGWVLALLYGPLLPWVTSFLLFLRAKEHRYWDLGDLFALALVLPFLQLASWVYILDFAALLYLFIHAVFSFVYAEIRMRHTFTDYSLKSALDSLQSGLAIANHRGKLLYVNKAFSEVLLAFGVDPHQKEKGLFSALRSQSFRLVDEASSILYLDGHYLLFRERSKGTWKSLTLRQVDAEMKLNEELREANASLQKEKTALLATLDEIKALAQHQERESLRVLVHDSFAEEVSLIHQVLINPAVNDLVPLKEVVREGLESYEKKYSSLDELEHFYGLLGVSFFEEGDFALCSDKVSVLSLVREATDNAIRHGNANEIHPFSSIQEGVYHLRITNNGISPLSATPHNGLAYLLSLFEQKGGHLVLVFSPRFALEVTLPLPKG
jgi:hypothetical protein